MKDVITYVVIFCWSSLISAEECLDPATSNPTAIHAMAKLLQNILPPEEINVSVDRTYYKRECNAQSKLGLILSTMRLRAIITKQYITTNKIIVTINDEDTFEIDKKALSVSHVRQFKMGAYSSNTCSGIYDSGEKMSVVHYVNVTLYTNRRMDRKAETNSYVFSDVRVYTLSESPLVQYALLGDEDHFLAVHLKAPYDMDSRSISISSNTVIKFSKYGDSRGNNSREFLRMHGTFLEKVFTQMKEDCEFLVFREYFKTERDSVKENVTYLVAYLTVIVVIIVLLAICVSFSCALNFWTVKRLWTIGSIQTSVPVTDVAEGQYEYVRCGDPSRSSDNGYEKVVVNAKKRRTSGYLTPVSSIRRSSNEDVIFHKNVDNRKVISTSAAGDTNNI